MATRKRVRYTFDIHFLDQVEKEAFQQRLKNTRELLTPAGRPPLDNLSLINTLFDFVEAGHSISHPTPVISDCSAVKSFMSNSGKYCTVGK